MIQWSDDDLDQMSQVTARDQKAAAKLWQDRAPKPFKDLLDAETEHDALPVQRTSG